MAKKIVKKVVVKKGAEKESSAEDAAVKKTVKKKAVKKVRAPKEVRLKAYWGVFNQSLRRVALFEFNQRKQAEKKADELTKNGKSPHFIQPVKEVIEG